MNVIIRLLWASVLLLGVTAANAIPITVSFQASGFGAGAPTDPVNGTFVYDAASTTGSINSLLSVSMVIAGHSYTLGEVGFESVGSTQFIAGTVGGLHGLTSATNDFGFAWLTTPLVPLSFQYTTPATISVVFTSTNFPQFSVTQSALPEPGMLALFGVVLGAFGITARRRKRASH